MHLEEMNDLKTQQSDIPFDVPILFILFNRPQHARRVLDRIREVRPAQLFIAIDGPREGNVKDIEGVKLCVELLNEIDWPCSVIKLIREQNLGCKVAVSSAITWFFSQVEFGIILEDDCLPDKSFFYFSRELLLKYEQDERVMHIGGTKLLSNHPPIYDSYTFSTVCHIWGWATWRRAWKHYDMLISDYPKHKESLIKEKVKDKSSQLYWRNIFDQTYRGELDTWDFQWVYCTWINNGLSIIPDRNLITNIGFGELATHTTVDSPFANLQAQSIDILQHPSIVEENISISTFFHQTLFRSPSTKSIWINRIRKGVGFLKKKWK
ncbi:hemolytic protein HlpA [Spirosoma daeguense]